MFVLAHTADYVMFAPVIAVTAWLTGRELVERRRLARERRRL